MAVADTPVVEVAAEAPIREAGLWSDAWRQLRRNPLFLAPAAIIAVFTVMAVAPGLFSRTDPRACDLYARKEPAVKEISMAKLFAGDLMQKVVYDCQQFHGGMGYVVETPVARAFRDARLLTIGGGTSEIMKEIIAKLVPGF